ncbi:MAG: tRNA pseudouridine(55) synthase TruB, partial [Ruminococcaceae bacterium]|nr:tRNA pseudouridine(55) synthase TruB [Oscillospiraceae bacterium]
MNGIFIIRKEKGYTSHDVVAVMRGILHTKKVGHTGTLDPDAEGVLPVCVGTATKAADMLTDADKEYIARVKLGMVTDTQDITGTVLERHPVTVSEEQIRAAAQTFLGEIDQIPPMYSAVKIDGKKLYEYARAGKEVERKPRRVTIEHIAVSEVSGDEFTLQVRCSKGTYIRTICHDLGQLLGCGGCMSALTRTRASGFTLEQAVTLKELEQAMEQGRAEQLLVPVDELFAAYPAFTANEEIATRLGNGAPSTVHVPKGNYRVYDENGAFLCVAEVVDYHRR